MAIVARVPSGDSIANTNTTTGVSFMRVTINPTAPSGGFGSVVQDPVAAGDILLVFCSTEGEDTSGAGQRMPTPLAIAGIDGFENGGLHPDGSTAFTTPSNGIIRVSNVTDSGTNPDLSSNTGSRWIDLGYAAGGYTGSGGTGIGGIGRNHSGIWAKVLTEADLLTTTTVADPQVDVTVTLDRIRLTEARLMVVSGASTTVADLATTINIARTTIANTRSSSSGAYSNTEWLGPNAPAQTAGQPQNVLFKGDAAVTSTTIVFNGTAGQITVPDASIFAIGRVISISGAGQASNNGLHVITAINPGSDLLFTTGVGGPSVVTESAGETVTITSGGYSSGDLGDDFLAIFYSTNPPTVTPDPDGPQSAGSVRPPNVQSTTSGNINNWGIDGEYPAGDSATSAGHSKNWYWDQQDSFQTFDDLWSHNASGSSAAGEQDRFAWDMTSESIWAFTSHLLLLKEEAAAGAKTVTPNVAQLGVTTATGSLTSGQARSVQGDSTLTPATSSASITAGQVRTVSGAASLSAVSASATITAGQARSLTASSALTPITASATITSAQALSITASSSLTPITASATLTAGQARSVSASAALNVATSSATISSSETVTVTASATLDPVTSSATLTSSQVHTVSASATLPAVGTAATISASQTRSISASATLTIVSASAAISVGGQVTIQATATIPAATTSATIAAGQTRTISSAVTLNGVTSSATVAAGQARTVQGDSSLGVVSASAVISASQTRTVTATAGLNSVAATASVSSIGVAVISASSVLVSVTSTAGIAIDGELKTITALTAVIPPITDQESYVASATYLISVTIDGVGDLAHNLLKRSEIVSVEEIWNIGLTQLGVGRVASADNDNSAQAALLRDVWDNFRQQFISDHAWNGCKTTAALTALPDSDFKDTTRWGNIFSLPSDYIRALTVNGYKNQPGNSETVMWEIEAVENSSGTKSRCLCTNQSSAKLEYVFDVGDTSTDLLSPAMKHAMGLALGAFVAPNFGKSANEITLMEQKVKEALLKAKGVDGQENSARYFSPSSLIESRYRSL